MQKTPRIPKSAPEAPPQRMKISGMGRFWMGIKVDQCCAKPDSTPADKKKDKVWYGLPSKRREYPTGFMKLFKKYMFTKKCNAPECTNMDVNWV